MAILHVKTPNGTTKTVDLETMNITSSLQQNGWCKLPNGLIIQWFMLSKDGTPSYTYTLPISFTKDCCGALSGNGNGPGDGHYVTINMYNLSMTQAFISTYDIRAASAYPNVVNYSTYVRCMGIVVGY